MELNLQFSDDDLECITSSGSPKHETSSYVPKFEDARWYMKKHPLDAIDQPPMELHHTASKLIVENRHEEALAIYQQLLEERVRNSAGTRELLDNCVRCLLKLGRPAEALPLLQRSRRLLLSRDHLLVWSQLAADVHERLQQPELSLPLRQAAVAADEQSPLAWLALADTYRALAETGHRPARSRRLRLMALLWAGVALGEAARAARSFVAEAARRRLAEVDAELAPAALVTDELRARLRLVLTGAGAADDEDEFVDRGSSKFHEKVDGMVQWDVPLEDFERKWFDLYEEAVTFDGV